MYLHRILDSEENIVKYERFIITDENCKNLIQDSIEMYEKGIWNENIQECLEENKDIIQKIDKRVVEFLEQNKNVEMDSFGNGYELALEILKANNIKVYDITEKHILY